MSRRRSDPNAERQVHRGPAPTWRGNRVFYVAVEGELTEPDYLTFLNREFGPEHQFLIHPLYKRNGMSPSRVVARALEQRRDVTSGDARVQLWALFDRDQHQDIPQAMRDAREAGVNSHNDKSVGGPRAQALHGKHKAAVKRAKMLVDHCSSGECSASNGHAEHCDPLRRDPSTDVWRLVVELGIVDQ